MGQSQLLFGELANSLQASPTDVLAVWWGVGSVWENQSSAWNQTDTVQLYWPASVYNVIMIEFDRCTTGMARTTSFPVAATAKLCNYPYTLLQ